MDVSVLKRDPVAGAKWLKASGDQYVATVDLDVYLPKSWMSGALANAGETITSLAVFAIVVGNKYVSSVSCCNLNFVPDTTSEIMIDDVPYLELHYEKGSAITTTSESVKNAPILFNIYDEFTAKGKKPWYIDGIDEARMMDTASYHAGATPGANRAILEMMVASRYRMAGDRSKYYKEGFKTQKEYDAAIPDVIPARSVTYGATNTSARLMGSYTSDAMNASLVNPSENLESIEELLFS